MTSAETYKAFDNKSSFGKLLFLSVIAIALCSFPPLAFLASVPIAIAFLLYSRATALVMGVISVGALLTIATYTKTAVYVPVLYLVSFFYALLISEVIYRGVSPGKGLLVTGTVLFAITMLFLGSVHLLKPTFLKQELSSFVTKAFEEQKKKDQKLLDSGTEEARQLKAFLDSPEKLVTEVYNNTPALVFTSAFLGIWLSFFVLLRNAKVWRYKVFYQYGLKDFLQFRVPDYLMWLVIIGLIFYLGADYGVGKEGEVIGTNILGSLAVLYFFQGFGIYNDFLSFVKIGGLLRIILTTFTVFFAWKMLVVLGLFDLWFNFRKFLKKQNGEGDKI